MSRKAYQKLQHTSPISAAGSPHRSSKATSLASDSIRPGTSAVTTMMAYRDNCNRTETQATLANIVANTLYVDAK